MNILKMKFINSFVLITFDYTFEKKNHFNRKRQHEKLKKNNHANQK